jgi:hypothetical protein
MLERTEALSILPRRLKSEAYDQPCADVAIAEFSPNRAKA